jgi:hypothetical protein
MDVWKHSSLHIVISIQTAFEETAQFATPITAFLEVDIGFVMLQIHGVLIMVETREIVHRAQ